MFTGIVQDMGRIASRATIGGEARLTIEVGKLDLSRVAIGDSISVQGCCLTAVGMAGNTFDVDASAETLALTTLGSLQAGAAVNLETALRAGDALGGHLVSGHVDGVGRIISIAADARSLRVIIEAPQVLARYIAGKGSVTVDGVSLTVNEVDEARFGVNLIPHTQSVTTLGQLQVGSPVNLEIDQIARYVERLLAAAR